MGAIFTHARLSEPGLPRRRGHARDVRLRCFCGGGGNVSRHRSDAVLRAKRSHRCLFYGVRHVSVAWRTTRARRMVYDTGPLHGVLHRSDAVFKQRPHSCTLRARTAARTNFCTPGSGTEPNEGLYRESSAIELR